MKAREHLTALVMTSMLFLVLLQIPDYPVSKWQWPAFGFCVVALLAWLPETVDAVMWVFGREKGQEGNRSGMNRIILDQRDHKEEREDGTSR